MGGGPMDDVASPPRLCHADPTTRTPHIMLK